MRSRTCFLTLLMALASGCTDQPLSHEVSLSAGLPVPAASTPLPSDAGVVPLQCRGATFFIAENSVYVKADMGTPPEMLPGPRDMGDYVPVGVGCARSAGSREYLVVEYGETPYGCKVCEWFFVYDGDGKPMNASVPPLRGYAESLEANNDEYEQKLVELGLYHPRIEYSASVR